MTQANASGSLDRNSDLVVASTYSREIAASLERVWENVYDWEHLPWLHAEAFNSIELVDSGDWGWRAHVELAGHSQSQIELIADRSAGHYVARTFAGAGTPSEIWTSLDGVAEDRTAIHVEFCVQPMPEEALRNLGNGYVSLYTLLWDQDEGMMRTRQSALDQARPKGSTSSLSQPVGKLDEIRSRLPMTLEFAGRPFRIVELDGDLVAHSTECPHRFGPLDACSIEDGSLACPWHGYRFDVRTGKSADGKSLRLRSAPRVVVDAASGQVTLVSQAAGAAASSGSAG
jgi:nitrite reductase/ring-hydroxylating ferredoxin subunit